MNGKLCIFMTFDFNAEVFHDGDGHVHVGFGVEVGGEGNFNLTLSIWRNHE